MGPKIGITTNFFAPNRPGAPSQFGAHYLNHEYFACLVRLGACPRIFAQTTSDGLMDAWLSDLDGLLLTGGFDIPASYFGETESYPEHLRGDPVRVDFELQLLQKSLRYDFPILGLCLGMQVLNVFFGGGLLQHIPAQREHALNHSASNADALHLAHEVEILEGSLLHQILQTTRLQVNSTHHQAVCRLGAGLIRSAWSPVDQITEGIESKCGRFLGVQWHPEALAATMPAHNRLFEWLLGGSPNGQ